MNDVGAGRYGSAAPRPYPTTVEVTRTPVVLALDVRRGWADASLLKRTAAVLFPVLLLAWLAAMTYPVDPSLEAEVAREQSAELNAWGRLYLLLGPPACYAAARILRPHPPGRQVERRVRHWCAAFGSAYGFVIAMLVFVDASDGLDGLAGGTMLATASVLGPLTVAWGLLAAVVRAVDQAPTRSRPSRSSQR